MPSVRFGAPGQAFQGGAPGDVVGQDGVQRDNVGKAPVVSPSSGSGSNTAAEKFAEPMNARAVPTPAAITAQRW